ncbi:heme peroxidase [Mycena rosella]|uniref:Heme peroxidase n=1 Tax=Mycena rosella TaxID=1033263 RepID=A0AAD7D2G5_MYCRO|nr:heme peroxidase [Mycena rosella]
MIRGPPPSLTPVTAGAPTNDDPDADGNVPDLGDGNGIPDVSNATNPICVPWYGIRDAILGGIFHGRCGDAARASVRIAFHDAEAGLPNGAADGSMIWDLTEVTRTENNGLQSIVSILSPLPAQFGVSPGDSSISQAFLAYPRPHGLVGAHTSGNSVLSIPPFANSTFDTTVDIWDVRFYAETARRTTPQGVLKLNSDVNFAHNTSTEREFLRFINNQEDWDEDYRTAHQKMSLLGQDVTTLTNCTELMPASINLRTSPSRQVRVPRSTLYC